MDNFLTGGDVERVVQILKSVNNFGGLVNWLDMEGEANNIQQYCIIYEPNTPHECRMRQLVTRYCHGEGIHKTILDIAYVLEHRMGHKRQADALLQRSKCTDLFLSSCVMYLY